MADMKMTKKELLDIISSLQAEKLSLIERISVLEADIHAFHALKVKAPAPAPARSSNSKTGDRNPKFISKFEYTIGTNEIKVASAGISKKFGKIPTMVRQPSGNFLLVIY